MFILGIIILVIAVFLVGMFNSLVVKRNRVREAFSHIDVQLKRRAALIPNLVEAVKGYVKHEKSVLEEVTKARAALVGASSKSDKAKANDMLSGALKSLFAVAEAYPNLKASDNFKELQTELADTEDKVAASRQFYNTNVLDFNTLIETFPGAVFASMFGFNKEEFFKAEESERADVKVTF